MEEVESTKQISSITHIVPGASMLNSPIQRSLRRMHCVKNKEFTTRFLQLKSLIITPFIETDNFSVIALCVAPPFSLYRHNCHVKKFLDAHPDKFPVKNSIVCVDLSFLHPGCRFNTFTSHTTLSHTRAGGRLVLGGEEDVRREGGSREGGR